MSLVDGRVIRQRMDAKDARMAREQQRRMNRNGANRSVPHAAPFPAVRTPAEGRKLITLIQHPLPLVRAAGDLAYETGEDNPYLDPDSAESLNWDAGYRDAKQRNS